MTGSWSDSLNGLRGVAAIPALAIAEMERKSPHSPNSLAVMGWLTLAIAAVCAACIILATGMRLTLSGLIPLGTCIVLLAAGHLRYERFVPDLRLSLATGTLTMLITAGVLAGIISHVGLRLHCPLIDGMLLAFDHAVFANTEEIVGVFGRRQMLLHVLATAYATALPFCIITVIYQSAKEQAFRAWEAATTFAICIIIAGLIGAFFPAIGNMAYAQMDPGILGLPRNAGIYYIPVFNAIYYGNAPEFDLRQMTGVVTFPSFHMVMALIPAWAFRGRRFLGSFFAIWGLIIAVSAIPFGGHYFVDLLVGGVLWGASVIVFRKFAPRAVTIEAAKVSLVDYPVRLAA